MVKGGHGQTKRFLTVTLVHSTMCLMHHNYCQMTITVCVHTHTYLCVYIIIILWYCHLIPNTIRNQHLRT